MWNIAIVDDSMRKQFSKEIGDNMSALPATVGWPSLDIPVGTVRRALAIAELSGSDTVLITIILERLVDLSLENLYYKRIDRKQTTLSHNYTHTKKKKKKPKQLHIHTITGMCTGSMK